MGLFDKKPKQPKDRQITDLSQLSKTPLPEPAQEAPVPGKVVTEKLSAEQVAQMPEPKLKEAPDDSGMAEAVVSSKPAQKEPVNSAGMPSSRPRGRPRKVLAQENREQHPDPSVARPQPPQPQKAQPEKPQESPTDSVQEPPKVSQLTEEILNLARRSILYNTDDWYLQPLVNGEILVIPTDLLKRPFPVALRLSKNAVDKFYETVAQVSKEQ